MAARAERRAGVVGLLHGVRHRLDGQAAGALYHVLDEVAAGAEHDERFALGGGREQRAEAGKELHGVSFVWGWAAGAGVRIARAVLVRLSAGVLAPLQISYGKC